jgi:hypothetical protein
MKKTLSHTALALLLLCSAAAQAANFRLTGSTDSIGPLPSASFDGLFSYSTIGLPTDGETALTAFSLNLGGQTYTLAGATAAATAVFAGGSFVGLSYLDDASTDLALRPQIALVPGFSTLPEAYLSYIGNGGLGGFGSYSVSVVPEPAIPALWLGGLALIGTVRARRR